MLHLFPDFQGDIHTRCPGFFCQPGGIGEQDFSRANLDQQGRQAF
jgi:hypothetical protein